MVSSKEVRLIDANRIVEVAEHAYHEWTLAMVSADDTRKVNEVFKKQYLCKVVKAIAEACPTIDIESLRPHGKWIKRPDERICPFCNDRYSYFGGKENNFCSNCGAKMEVGNV